MITANAPGGRETDGDDQRPSHIGQRGASECRSHITHLLERERRPVGAANVCRDR